MPEPDVREVPRPLGRTAVLTAQAAVIATICRAASAVRQHLENSVLRSVDLTWTAFVVLRVVWARGESETRHVAQEAGISKGTLTGVSRTLERRGFIRRSGHPCDGRLVLLSLTAEGEALMLRLFPKFDQEVIFVTARLSDEECRSVGELLRGIVHHVEEKGREERRLTLLDGAPTAPRRHGAAADGRRRHEDAVPYPRSFPQSAAACVPGARLNRGNGALAGTVGAPLTAAAETPTPGKGRT